MMFRWLIGRWHARQRAIDLKILWPACKEQANDLGSARKAFFMHAAMDPAWSDLDPDKISLIISRLT